MKILFHFLFFLFFLVSCSSDEPNNSLLKNQGIPIAILTQNRGANYFEYNNQRQLIKLTDKSIYSDNNDNNSTVTYEISYDAENKVSAITSKTINENYPSNYIIKIYTPTYGKNEMTLQIDNSTESSTSSYKMYYFFDAQNRLTKIMDANNKIITSFEYDVKGNLIKKMGPSYNYEYEYENTLGISRNINTPFWALVLLSEDSYLNFATSAINNVVTIRSQIANSVNDKSNASVNYTYDENGIPQTFNYKGGGYYSSPYTIQYK